MKLEPKEEKRIDPVIGWRTVDMSAVTLKRLSDEKVFTLQINDTQFAETLVELVLPIDNTVFSASAGGFFVLRGSRYRVISVDNEALSVVIESESTGKKVTLGR